MRKQQWAVVAAVVVLSACAGADSKGGILSTAPDADGPRMAFTPGAGTLYVRGQTTGKDRSVWKSNGDYETCSTSRVNVDWQSNTYTVDFSVRCGTSAWSGPDYSFYDGGIVNIGVTTDTGIQWLGYVTGDLTREGATINVPAGASVVLQANANSGCSFASYTTSSGSYTYSNPWYISSSSSIASVQGRFVCG